MAIIGLDFYGINTFESPTPRVREFSMVTVNNAVHDELSIRERIDIDITEKNTSWEYDTVLLAKYEGNLEAGNINNNGVEINKFAIKRREVGDTKTHIVGYKDFVNNNEFVFQDFTQPNGDYIYSITPIGVNGLLGQDNSISATSNFAGWFVVDAENNFVLPFDKFMGDKINSSTTLNQSRTKIETLTKYPSFFYSEQEYHEFSMESIFVPNEWQRSGGLYEDILNKFIRTHKPLLVKGGSGERYIVDLHSPTKSAPNNVYKGHDYMKLTVQATEVMDYDEYIDLTIGGSDR